MAYTSDKIHRFHPETRMVQLPATAAIEYVAACWVSGAGGLLSGVLLSGGSFARGTFSPGDFFPGSLLPVGTFGREDFCPGGLLLRAGLSGGSFARGTFARGTFVRGLMPVPPNFNAYTNRLSFLCLA